MTSPETGTTRLASIAGGGEAKNLGFRVGGGVGGVSSVTELRVRGWGLADTGEEGVAAGLEGWSGVVEDRRRRRFEEGRVPRRRDSDAGRGWRRPAVAAGGWGGGIDRGRWYGGDGGDGAVVLATSPSWKKTRKMGRRGGR